MTREQQISGRFCTSNILQQLSGLAPCHPLLEEDHSLRLQPYLKGHQGWKVNLTEPGGPRSLQEDSPFLLRCRLPCTARPTGPALSPPPKPHASPRGASAPLSHLLPFLLGAPPLLPPLCSLHRGHLRSEETLTSNPTPPRSSACSTIR